MRWPIRHQILIPFAGILLAAVLSVSLLSAYWAAAHAQRQIEEQLRGVASTLVSSTFPLTANVLAQTHALTGADFAVTDAAGAVTAASGDVVGQALPEVDRVTDNWRDLHLGPVVTLGDAQYFHVAVPVDRRGGATSRGLLHILYPERVLRDARRQAAVPPLVVGAVALIVCVAVATWTAARLSRPLVEMRTQLQRMAGGDFRPIDTPARNDEVRDVAASVNELARQLDELRRAIARAERLSVLGKLSGGLAHHLRNDVTGALMAVQMHRRHCHEGDQESLDVAQRQLGLIEEHLKRFLAAGQPEQPRRAAFDPHELSAELVNLLAPMARHRHVELSCVPPAAPLVLDADREQLRQALMNLILNALEAVGREGTVRIEVEAADNRIAWRVLDSGPGLSAELHERFGEAFLTTKPEGVGLGLAVARRVAEGHDGMLSYCRTEGMTCFELSLPTAVPPKDATAKLPFAKPVVYEAPAT